MTGGNFATCHKVSTIPQKLGDWGAIFLDVYISKSKHQDLWERHSWGIKLTKVPSSFQKDFYTSQWDKKLCKINYKCSQVKDLKKKKGGRGISSGRIRPLIFHIFVLTHPTPMLHRSSDSDALICSCKALQEIPLVCSEQWVRVTASHEQHRHWGHWLKCMFPEPEGEPQNQVRGGAGHVT